MFLINVPIGILSLFLVSMFVDEPRGADAATRKSCCSAACKVDFIGFVLVALFLGCLEVTLDRGQRDDWFSSPIITTAAIVGALVLHRCSFPGS